MAVMDGLPSHEQGRAHRGPAGRICGAPSPTRPVSTGGVLRRLPEPIWVFGKTQNRRGHACVPPYVPSKSARPESRAPRGGGGPRRWEPQAGMCRRTKGAHRRPGREKPGAGPGPEPARVRVWSTFSGDSYVEGAGGAGRCGACPDGGIALGWATCGPPACLFLSDPREDPARPERDTQRLSWAQHPSWSRKSGGPLGRPRRGQGGQAWDA